MLASHGQPRRASSVLVPNALDRSSVPSFDLIVIGAGINGAGIARDAAMRGLKVLLLDKGDIGSGTSSWSTRLIHGGLRYLEHGEFNLVRESLREREVLLRIAPHLVRPIPLLIPIYANARRGWWTIRTGMIAYDLLSFDKSLPRHQMVSAAEALTHAPGLATPGLRGAALYWDAQVEFAERLVLENALSAREHGAEVITYTRVEKLIIEDGRVCGVVFTDQLSRQSQSARAKLTLNAAGPWVDQVAAGGGVERMIGGTKGSHVIVTPFPGAPNAALYVEAKADRRPFFVIPWNGNYLIGTTDIRYEGDLDAVAIDDSEIEYLLGETNQLLPDARLTRDSIAFTYSGVRPLAFTADKDEQSITRRHFIRDHAPRLHGFVSIIGGKLTTYRSLAEHVVNLVFKKLGLHSQRCTTLEVPLPGAVTPNFVEFCNQFRKETGLPEPTSERLLKVYGTRAPSILKLITDDAALSRTLSAESGALAAEVVFAFQDELAETLTDCLLRRTMIGLSPTARSAEARAAAKIAQDYLGWSDERARCELADYRVYRNRFHRAGMLTSI